MHYPHVASVRKNFPSSSTEPLDAELDSGERVIVKPINNIQGNLVLVNEYICYRLCRYLGLPIPGAGIAIIDGDTSCLCDPPVFSNDNYGTCFYSTRVNKVAPINPAIIPRLSNKEEFYRVILFDHLVYNTDRNKGNLLVTSGMIPQLYMIDHSHVFKNATIWDRYCFKQGIEGNDYEDRQIVEANEIVYGYFWECLDKNRETLSQCVSSFTNLIKPAILDEIFSVLPSEWQPCSEDMAALKEYIIYRLAHLDEMCDMI